MVRLLTVFGVFTILPLAALFLRGSRRWVRRLDGPLFALIPVAGIQMLLSGNFGRMAVVVYPLFCVATAVALDALPWRKLRLSPRGETER